jgi:predicted metal-dependent enzyme (double-stranded beta helix superfamily)
VTSSASRASVSTFDRAGFVEQCRQANRDGGQAAVHEVLKRAVADHSAVLAALPPVRAGMDVLHRSPDLTVFAAAWTPQMNLPPHDHRMWALIGVYTGREDNIFWSRGGPGRPLTAAGARVLFEGDVATLPIEVIHSVTNPLDRFTGALHVYGGDFFETPRSQWTPDTLQEQRSDGDVIRAIFEAENRRFAARTRCEGAAGI